MTVVYVLSREGHPPLAFSSSRRVIIHIMATELTDLHSYYLDDRYKKYPLVMPNEALWREIELKLKHGHLGIKGFINGDVFTIEQAQVNPAIPISKEPVY
jgi:hypothetical protein